MDFGQLFEAVSEVDKPQQGEHIQMDGKKGEVTGTRGLFAYADWDDGKGELPVALSQIAPGGEHEGNILWVLK